MANKPMTIRELVRDGYARWPKTMELLRTSELQDEAQNLIKAWPKNLIETHKSVTSGDSASHIGKTEAAPK